MALWQNSCQLSALGYVCLKFDIKIFKTKFRHNGYPQANNDKTALIVNKETGLWRNAKPDNPEYKRTCFCQKKSVPGEPTGPEYPSLPINDLCEKDRLYVESSEKCIYHDIKVVPSTLYLAANF